MNWFDNFINRHGWVAVLLGPFILLPIVCLAVVCCPLTIAFIIYAWTCGGR